MWVPYGPPLVPRKADDRVGIRKKKTQADPSPESSPSSSNDNQASFATGQLGSNIAGLLEPALDGPPSPERIRALSKQVKTGSAADRHHSQQTSSGSSSLRSLTSGDRPSWEQVVENTTLSRKSSTRSTSSSMPSRERPESVQIFGKTIFNRRTKLKRESSAQSSSASSIYSGEVPTDAAAAAPSARELIPGIFNRRRTMKAEAARDDAALRRRLQISGPYNFQHVTHTHKDTAPGVRRMDRAEYSALQSTGDALRDGNRGHPGEGHFAGFSSETLPLEDDMGMLSPYSEPQFDISHYPGSPGSPPRRPVRGTRSQEQLRLPPPRPPRSPLEPSFAAPSPAPQMPQRHTSGFSDGFDQAENYEPSQLLAGGGFRHPQPFAPAEQPEDIPISPQTLAEGQSAGENRFSHAFGNALDASNWPLICPMDHNFETALPDVPEEEEQQAAPTHRSRASVRSTNSSLRGSHSVPLLRQMAQPQPATRRPPSGESVTLGRLELYGAQKGQRQDSLRDGDDVEASARDSWEEVIDYCYDHQAEASCDYAWDRPSLDLIREDVSTDGAGPRMEHGRRDSELLPGMFHPGQFDAPALSPASQISTALSQEGPAPAVAGLPAPRSNFSRKEPRQRLLHIRTTSQVSSFRESHGFDLSPSLFIPGDYHQELLAHQAAKLSGLDDLTGGPLYEEPGMTMNTSTLLVQSRSSASTTETQDSAQASERHISAASTSTDYTRLTASIASMHIDDMGSKQEHGSPVPEASAPMPEYPASRSPMPVLFETDSGLEKPFGRVRGRGSESNLLKKGSEDLSAGLRREPLHTRRGRARTTSLSSPPPTGQYAIFPSIINMTGHCI